MGTVHYTDEALLLSDDLEDFGRFYDRYVKALLAFFQRRVGDPEVAADLTAETFAAAMVARGRYQHLAVVLDDRILSLPYVDFDTAPAGIDGAEGARIHGGLTPQAAREIAAIMSTGPLPAALSDLSERPVADPGASP